MKETVPIVKSYYLLNKNIVSVRILLLNASQARLLNNFFVHVFLRKAYTCSKLDYVQTAP